MDHSPQRATRQLRPDDLEAVVEIDRRITGRSRRAFFEKRLRAALADVHGFITTAVESGDGGLSGYAIARLQDGEFGDDHRVATLDVIGVDPDCRDHGQGSLLLDRTREIMARLDVHELRTQVAWHEAPLTGFFAHSGFALAPRQVLERSTAPTAWDRAGRGEAPDSDEDARRQDAGVPDYSEPGGDGASLLARDTVLVRSLVAGDLDAAARIDRKLTGRGRRAFLEAKLREVLGESGIRISQVAEMDGAAVGFVMARVDYGEYGRAEPAAVLDVLGVDPGFAGRGVGRALLSQLVLNLAGLQVETLRTTVRWNNFPLLGFFDGAGFVPSQQLLLSRPAG